MGQVVLREPEGLHVRVPEYFGSSRPAGHSTAGPPVGLGKK